jgi:hypothetical protein
MAAMTAQATFSFKWTDADGNAFSAKGRTIQFPGTLLLHGSLPIPAGLSAGAEVDLPFLGIADGASFIYLENAAGQELGMAWGGNFYPHLPNEGVMMYMFPNAVSPAGAVTSWRFFLTQAQAEVGYVNFAVFGT